MMERKKIVVLNGIHGSGKTHYGHLLAEKYPKRFTFFPEIGGQLRSEVDYNVLHSGVAFDQEVLKRESARDEDLLHVLGFPVVETWHTGNMAYVMGRSQGMLPSFQRVLEQRLSQMEPLVFWFTITWETFMQRMTENVSPDEIPSLVSFYSVLADNLLRIYEEFEIPYVEVANNTTSEYGFVEVQKALTSQRLLTVA